ncbi:MAG TPA: bifunctional DNA-binding transcriptional regulator/O6-methylguanine-DNA methyltransferase Ada [Acidobacteriaceae bacterium]|nr:bifunctional DNA-binding transcriptional regulator/O6-methylguanine-DNA methyltransferase Ada [Acidobacteriaceae bacterium]
MMLPGAAAMLESALPLSNAALDTSAAKDNDRWQAVLRRDPQADGRFVYAVRTTGIFCRPSCPSRRPARGNVVFFLVPEHARLAGYRACIRCAPESMHPLTARLLAACSYLDRVHEKVPTLSEVGHEAGVSGYALQRLFRRVLGVTPHEYYATRRAQDFRHQLRTASTVTAAIYQAGFGSSSRVYEQRAGMLGMNPGKYRKGAAGQRIRYTTAISPLGRILVASTTRGLCAVAFGETEEELVAGLLRDFPNAEVELDSAALAANLAGVLALLQEHPTASPLPVDVRATAFQRRVWEALQQIPFGETRSYSDLARSLGRPEAVRAVARACGQNPVAIVVPCHRVIGKDGQMTGYRWGIERKRQLLEQERRSAAKNAGC